MYKKILSFFCLLIIVLGLSISTFVSPAYAADDCGSRVIVTKGDLGKSFSDGSITSLPLTLDVSGLGNGSYQLFVYDRTTDDPTADIGNSEEFTVTDANHTQPVSVTLTASGDAFSIAPGTKLVLDNDAKYVYVYKNDSSALSAYCKLGEYTITENLPSCTQPTQVYQERNDAQGTPQKCFGNDNGCLTPDLPITVETSGLLDSSKKPWDGTVRLMFNGYGLDDVWFDPSISGGSIKEKYTLGEGTYTLTIHRILFDTEFKGACNPTSFKITARCEVNQCQTHAPSNNDSNNEEKPFLLCSQITNAELKGKCETCAGGVAGREGVWTAVGCIKRDPQSIIKRFIEIGIGVGGGICLLTCLAAGFMLTTSQGDLKQATEAKNMLTSAIIGILFIIFSVVILQFIGVTILNIPGFGTA